MATTKRIDNGSMPFDARVSRASSSRVEVTTKIALDGGVDEHVWIFMPNERGTLRRVSVAAADSTEDENYPRAWKVLARGVARMAGDAYRKALGVS